ncbi:MAG TPA: hypothetical protein VH436_34425 [Vicinamibacterales bacterium]
MQNQPHHILTGLSPHEPPIRLATIVGDCVTNARAALDYIVYQLAVRYFVPLYDPLRVKSKIVKTVADIILRFDQFF